MTEAIWSEQAAEVMFAMFLQQQQQQQAMQQQAMQQQGGGPGWQQAFNDLFGRMSPDEMAQFNSQTQGMFNDFSGMMGVRHGGFAPRSGGGQGGFPPRPQFGQNYYSPFGNFNGQGGGYGGYFGGQAQGVGRYQPPMMDQQGGWQGGNNPYNYNLPNAFGSYPG
jgi:hypothetical protein